jgi:hypothetical protein
MTSLLTLSFFLLVCNVVSAIIATAPKEYLGADVTIDAGALRLQDPRLLHDTLSLSQVFT